jgi:hypothetical protein
MKKKKKEKIETDSIIDLFSSEEEDERDLSWMIDGVRTNNNTNQKKGNKNDSDKRSVKKHR